MKKLRIGVIGLGMGKGHIHGYKQHPQADVVAITDLDRNRLEAVSAELNIPGCYTSVDDMLAKENLDIVSVATPNNLHKPFTIAALEAGCHVLCEKPMAINTSEAEAMLAASVRLGKRLMINFSSRFSAQSFALKKQVESGVLGDIYYGRSVWMRRRGMPGFGGWFGTKALSGGGPLIDLGVHRLDLALWLMEFPKPVWVLGNTYNPIATAKAKREGKTYDVEDMAVAMIRFENGATLELAASWATNIKENELMETRLCGTKGGLLQRNLNEGYQFEAELFLEQDGCQYDMKLHPPVPDAQGPMAHFVDCIVNDKPHTATAVEGVEVMKLLDAIYASSELGEPVKVN